MTIPYRYMLYAAIGVFLVGSVIGGLIVYNQTKPVVLGHYIGVVTVKKDTVYPPPVLGTVAHHTTPKTDSTYKYGFKLQFPDSAHLALDVNTKNVPRILDSLLGVSYVYTPAPRITITNTRVDTFKISQNRKLFAVTVGGGITYTPQKQVYYGANIGIGYKLAEF
jgi:hypothetical protein